MPALLALLGYGNAVVKAVLSWLSHRSFWQLVAMGLAGLCLLLAYQRDDARHDRDSYKRQRNYYKGELAKISSKRDTQKVVTRDNLKVVTRIVHDADERAKVIENAPPTEGCKTAPEIMGADL